MELIAMWRVIMRRWWLILLPVAVVAVFVVPDMLRTGIRGEGGFSVTLRYTANQKLDAFPDRLGDYQDVWLASELLVNALTDWVRTSRFADEVNTLLVDVPQWTLAADNERSVGVITISSPDADALERVTEGVMTILTTRTQAYFPQLGNTPADVVFLDMPTINSAPPPLTDRFGGFLRLGLALLAGLGLAFLVEYLSPVVHYADELERMGVTVIAKIPKG
jgi:hypothetical protein